MNHRNSHRILAATLALFAVIFFVAGAFAADAACTVTASRRTARCILARRIIACSPSVRRATPDSVSSLRAYSLVTLAWRWEKLARSGDLERIALLPH